MSNIIEHDGDDLNGSLSVDGGQSSVSLETYQAIYQKITGRSEKTVQKYHDNILVDFSELEQMHMKVMQLCDVHTIKCLILSFRVSSMLGFLTRMTVWQSASLLLSLTLNSKR
jgi:hypothetical protein